MGLPAPVVLWVEVSCLLLWSVARQGAFSYLLMVKRREEVCLVYAL